MAFAFVAHRAVVDVDPELGLVKVLQVATAQDIGKALNPLAVTGQIEGGIAQGVGLAVMEEIVLDQGKVRNPSFTDYLLPTALDMPPVVQTWVEQPERGAPYGAKGVGEPPTISSTGAVVAAIRQATGLPLTRIPVRPDDIALAPEAATYFGARTARPHPPTAEVHAAHPSVEILIGGRSPERAASLVAELGSETRPPAGAPSTRWTSSSPRASWPSTGSSTCWPSTPAPSSCPSCWPAPST